MESGYVGERTDRQGLPVELCLQNTIRPRDLLQRARIRLPHFVQHRFELRLTLPSCKKSVRSDPIHGSEDSFPQGRIQIVAEVDQLVRRSAGKVPEGVGGRLVLELSEGSEVQESLGISFGDPSEVDVGIDMDRDAILEFRLFPRIIGPVVILHHHDVLYGIGPHQSALSSRVITQAGLGTELDCRRRGLAHLVNDLLYDFLDRPDVLQLLNQYEEVLLCFRLTHFKFLDDRISHCHKRSLPVDEIPDARPDFIACVETLDIL